MGTVVYTNSFYRQFESDDSDSDTYSEDLSDPLQIVPGVKYLLSLVLAVLQLPRNR